MGSSVKNIYAIPNYECNLRCPHCDVHKNSISYDRDQFISTLKKLERTSVITLFGGEPTLYQDRFLDICNNVKVSSVSTNLVQMTDSVFEVLVKPEISIATSWNMTRFNKDQFVWWLKNLEKLGNAGKQSLVLITLTPDLICDKTFQILDVLSKVDMTRAVSKVLFEHLVSSAVTEKFQEMCDDWLCQIHEKWNFSFSNEIEKKIFDWKFDCSNTYTVQPSGKISPGCPQYEGPKVNMRCLSCERATVCHPCALQSTCTFPKKLFKLIQEESSIM